MARKLTDEKLLEMLMRTGSVKDAAAELGCTRQTLYRRIKEPAFRAKYAAARDDAIKATSAVLSSRMRNAVDYTTKIMVDNLEKDPRTSLSAASSILRYGLQFYELADITARLEALEDAQAENTERR